MATCVGWVREDGRFQFFSGRYGSDDISIFVGSVHGAARFETVQAPEVVRFVQRMGELKREFDYRDVPEHRSAIELHPDVAERLSKLLHPDAVTIFVDQEGHGLSPDPRVHLYPWTGDAGSFATAHETHREAGENPQHVLELPGWHGRKLLSRRDTENLKKLLDDHGVRHGAPWEGDE